MSNGTCYLGKDVLVPESAVAFFADILLVVFFSVVLCRLVAVAIRNGRFSGGGLRFWSLFLLALATASLVVNFFMEGLEI